MGFFKSEEIDSLLGAHEAAADLEYAFLNQQLAILEINTHGHQTVIDDVVLLSAEVVEGENGQFLLKISTDKGVFLFDSSESPSQTWLGDYTVRIEKARWLLEGPPSITIAAHTEI